MNIVDHGRWTIYTAPDELLARRGLTREHAVVFSKKIDTGEDWYDYGEARFTGATVMVTMIEQHDGLITGAAHTDYRRIFPANGGLIEITDYTGSDPQADFGNKIYDPANGTFTEREPPPPPAVFVEMRKEMEQLRADLNRLLNK